jgi:transcriptional regulator with XRE-family HTH domain
MRARDVILIARRRAGLTQQQLARRLGVPQVTVARWESGTTEPKFDAVQKAVGACGLDLTLGFATPMKGHGARSSTSSSCGRRPSACEC